MRTFMFALLALTTSLAHADSPRIVDITFESHGILLSGSIAWPVDAPRAAVVFVHGSGKQTRNLALARRFTEAGIAALVYDKRGAGQSGGEYESKQSVSGPNIELLAADAAASLNALRKRIPQDVPAGLTGISQAGWIVPLAAERVHADFLVLWSGPVCKVSEEDIYSIYTRDADSPHPPSFQQALDSRTEPYLWPPALLGTDTDPATSLRKLHMPGLWIFGGRDGSIPVELSITRLLALKREFQHILFPGEGHDNMDTTFNVATDWILAHARRSR
jgi:uncharacterized protein